MKKDRREFLKLASAGALAFGLQPITNALTASQAQAAASENFWENLRNKYFSLSTDYIYMNNSTFGASLNQVVLYAQEVQHMFAQGCSLTRFLNSVIFRLPGIYTRMARIINGHDQAGGKYIGIVDSVTEGMSLVANGLNINSNDVILTTDHEHTGGLTCWQLQQERKGARVVEIPLVQGGYGQADWQNTLLARFEAALASRRVKAVSFSYTTTSTGHVLPAGELCALARRYGAISVIDAAQAFAIVPLDMQALDCDFMVMNGHKYLNGPIGSGFICVNPRMVNSLDSFWGTVVDDNVFYPESLARNRPYRQGGVQAYASVLPLSEALAFYADELGPQLVYDRLCAIGRWLRTGLSRYGSTFEILTPLAEGQSAVTTCFRINGMSSESAVDTLSSRYSIEVKHAEEGGADAIRLAPHYYNTGAEFMSLAMAICNMAGVSLEPWLEDNPLDGLPPR